MSYEHGIPDNPKQSENFDLKILLFSKLPCNTRYIKPLGICKGLSLGRFFKLTEGAPHSI